MEKNRKINKLSNIIILFLIFIILIFNNTFVNATDEIVISEENWKEWQEEDYWEWHTRKTNKDKAYNGTHIVIQNDVIDFYGYGQNSYKDFLFKEYENRGIKTFKFIIDESKANYHTLDGAGFIFNAKIEDEKISGYILLFREQDICIYRIENIELNKFENTTSTTVADFGELVQSIIKTENQLHELSVEVSPTNLKIEEKGTEILNVDLDYSIHIGESFGLISSYVQHDCEILSTIEFSQFEMILEDYNFSVLNTDLDRNSISGAHFVLKDEKGEVIKFGKTNNAGIFDVGNLKEGKYTIQQILEPKGYILNDNIYIFNVTADGRTVDNNGEEINLIIKNKPYEEKQEEKDNEQKDNNQVNNIQENNDVGTNVKEQVSNKQKDASTSKTALPYAGGATTLLKIILILTIFTTIALLLKLIILKK